jgi:P27 family predicted phage terminase small subunit
MSRPKRCPSPPRRLTKHGREEWLRLAPVAHRLGTLNDVTLRTFELLVETLATERTARDQVASAGMTTKTADGGLKPHPAIRVAERARQQATELLKQFGLMPSGKAPSNATPKPKDSKWAGILDD